jgi:hypothetical protein
MVCATLARSPSTHFSREREYTDQLSGAFWKEKERKDILDNAYTIIKQKYLIRLIQ